MSFVAAPPAGFVAYNAISGAGNVLNPAKTNASLTLSNGNQTITKTGSDAFASALTFQNVPTYPAYWEASSTDSAGWQCGLVPAGFDWTVAQFPGETTGWGFAAAVPFQIYIEGTRFNTALTAGSVANAVYGYAYNPTSEKVWFRDTAFPDVWYDLTNNAANPATNTGGIDVSAATVTGGKLALSTFASGTNATVDVGLYSPATGGLFLS